MYSCFILNFTIIGDLLTLQQLSNKKTGEGNPSPVLMFQMSD